MSEADSEETPSHHARRPMNAFLIFCKRHRSVVRDKYPNLENRSITKILGEWWANLDKEDKHCYTSLAKQYKDAFFNANPDFKWYKLPAPPLRTLSARPASDKHLEAYAEHYQEKTNNNSTKYDFNKRFEPKLIDAKAVSSFNPGKLADEAHMGGLSSLITSPTETKDISYFFASNMVYKQPNALPKSNIFPNLIDNNTDRTKVKTEADNIRELQHTLSETTRLFSEDFNNVSYMKSADIYQDTLTNQQIINQIVDKKLYCSDDNDGPNRNSDDEKNKGTRSCKGKRYQEFMAVGGLLVNKRHRRDERCNEDHASCSWNYNSDSQSFGDETEQKMDVKHEAKDSDDELQEQKAFKPADFDLDAKIQALPSLSLEQFQQKKRESKKKKKSFGFKSKPSKKHTLDETQTEREPKENYLSISSFSTDDYHRRQMAEQWKKSVIGSQKRKPRKHSITRLEVNSDGEIEGIVEEPTVKISRPTTLLPQGNGIDLFALATLAEVAANTSKIEDFNQTLYTANVGSSTQT